MVQLYKTIIKDFDHPYFVSAFASCFGIKKLQFSQKKGITSPDFVHECKQLFTRFSQQFEYSQSTVEKFFKVKFAHLKIEKQKILRFQDIPSYGSDVIYITKR